MDQKMSELNKCIDKLEDSLNSNVDYQQMETKENMKIKKKLNILKDIDMMFKKNLDKQQLTYKDLLENISEFTDSEEDKQLFKNIDIDNDGFITLDEFKKYIHN